MPDHPPLVDELVALYPGATVGKQVYLTAERLERTGNHSEPPVMCDAARQACRASYSLRAEAISSLCARVHDTRPSIVTSRLLPSAVRS